ncbi:HofP DNA utilization family protein [Klebsiella sp. 141161]|uniref:HofP DNA utilization family protein n=1 Tax=Klebsiella sp. 141161 TaxID=3020037 RepID=UPI003D33F9AD
MNHKGYLLLLFCPLLAGARDPFLPVEDRCQTTQLTQWRYGGGTGRLALWLGLIQERTGQWRRVRSNDVLPGGWRIRQLTAETLTLEASAGCEPARWVWSRKGSQHDAKDKSAATSAAAAAGRGGEKRTAGVVGG